MTEPSDFFCPICKAPPNNPCTEPLEGTYHVARVFRAREAAGVRGARTLASRKPASSKEESDIK
jgi:hypothetical protein